MTEHTKRCYVCGEIKPESEFYKRGSGKLRGKCKLCEKLGRTSATKLINCRMCGKEITVSLHASKMPFCPECKVVNDIYYRKKRKPVTEVNLCEMCEHEKMCRKNIWVVWFAPPCFVGEKDKLIQEAQD